MYLKTGTNRYLTTGKKRRDDVEGGGHSLDSARIQLNN